MKATIDIKSFLFGIIFSLFVFVFVSCINVDDDASDRVLKEVRQNQEYLKDIIRDLDDLDEKIQNIENSLGLESEV
ncbi:hypothetical protein ACFLS9_00700 [Bacteroidota bacterium]